jgi:hypothetical protein
MRQQQRTVYQRWALGYFSAPMGTYFLNFLRCKVGHSYAARPQLIPTPMSQQVVGLHQKRM